MKEDPRKTAERAYDRRSVVEVKGARGREEGERRVELKTSDRGKAEGKKGEKRARVQGAEADGEESYKQM